MKLNLKNVRIAFPELWVAKAVADEGQPAFSASFLVAPDHPCVKEVKAAINTVATEKWGKDASKVLAGLEKNGKLCLRDGDTKEAYAGYAGNMFIAARSPARPLVIDRDKSPLSASDGRPYSGCYVNASIELWAQDNKYGKRVNAQLRGVQFLKDGEPFSGAVPASPDEFDELGMDDDDDLTS